MSKDFIHFTIKNKVYFTRFQSFLSYGKPIVAFDLYERIHF